MRSKERVPALGILLTVMLVLGACGGPGASGGGNGDGASSIEDAAADAELEPEVTSIKIGFSALEPASLPVKVALDLGFFEKYGLDVELVSFDGDTLAVQALESGAVQAISAGGAIALASARTEEPNVLVALVLSNPTDMLVSRPDIETPEDLVGEDIAVSQFGGDSHASVLLSLKNFDIEPDEVTVVQVGGQSARIAAVVAGSVAAAPVDQTSEAAILEEGLNVLVKLSETGLKTPRHGLMVPTDFILENPNTVLAMTAAMLEAINAEFEQTDEAAQAYADWAQLDIADAQAEVEGILPLVEDQRCLPSEAGWWDELKGIMTVSDPDIADVDPSRAYSTAFVARLEELGVMEDIGAPC
jgi:NitT/TauT family transport system substrate-binding protein